MISRFSRIFPRLVLAFVLLVAPLSPVPAARATTGVLDQIQIYGHGLFKTMADAVRWAAAETARRMMVTPSGLIGSDGFDLLRIGNVGPQVVVPEIVKMIVGQDGIATLTGRASPGSTIFVESSGQAVGTAQAAANGTWRLQLNYRLNEGDHNIQSLVRGPDGRGVVRGPGIRIAVPENFAGPSVVYQTPTLRPQQSREQRRDRTAGVGVGQAPSSDPRPLRTRSDDGAAASQNEDAPAAVNWLYRWLDTSSAVYQDVIIPDLSGTDVVTFPLALPEFDAPDRRRFATRRNGGDDLGEPQGDGWARPGLTDWFWDGAGLAESRVRDWLADARRVFGSNVVRELSTGEAISPSGDRDTEQETAARDVVPNVDQTRRSGAGPDYDTTEDAFPWPLTDGRQEDTTQESDGRTAESTIADAEPKDAQDRFDLFPWPFADDTSRPSVPPTDGPDVASEGSSEAPTSFPWPLATEAEQAPPQQPAEVRAEEVERRQQQEEAIRRVQVEAEKARALAKEAAEQARKSREETERLLAEEERLAKEAEKARAERQEATARQAKEDAERVAKQKADALAAEEESKRQAERLRRRAEELAAAATATADEEFARGTLAEPKKPTDMAQEDSGVSPSDWPVVQEGRRAPAGRRFSLKDSPADLVEEGSSEGDDADEVYVPDAEDIKPVKKRTAKPRRHTRRATSKRRTSHRARQVQKRKRKAHKASTRRHRHARKARHSNRYRASRKRSSHRRRVYQPRVRGLRYRRSSARHCVGRSLSSVGRSLRRHLGRLVRGHRRARRHSHYVGRVRWRRR